MSTAFLNALKNSAAKQNSNQIGNTDPNKGPVLLTDLVKQNQAKSAVQGKPLINVPMPTPVAPIKQDPLIVNCERVLNRNRLDVFFSRKPSDEILQKLRDQGFRYRSADKAWFHYDGVDNRAFCEREYGAVFDDIAPVQDSNNVQDSTISHSAAVQNVQDSEQSDNVNPAYETYKRQTNELIAHLKIEPSDLMLIAVNALHKITFSKDS